MSLEAKEGRATGETLWGKAQRGLRRGDGLRRAARR